MISIHAPEEYRLTGYIQMIKTATATGTTARIYVPGCHTTGAVLEKGILT